MEIVLFRNDLRIHDHGPLSNAAMLGDVLPLYIFEPAMFKDQDRSIRHYNQIREAVKDLDQALQDIGLALMCRRGEPSQVIGDIIAQSGSRSERVERVWIHKDVSTAYNTARDGRLAASLKEAGVELIEMPDRLQFDEQLLENDDRQQLIMSYLSEKRAVAPAGARLADFFGSHKNRYYTAKEMGLHKAEGQNVSASVDLLFHSREGLVKNWQNFASEYFPHYKAWSNNLYERHTKGPHLDIAFSYGLMSMREIVQPLCSRYDRYTSGGTMNPALSEGMELFRDNIMLRLHWSHLFEQSPELEFLPGIRRAGDNRLETYQEKYWLAFTKGETGFPFFDACIKCLLSQGRLPGPALSLLVQFATIGLWLPVRKTGEFIAGHLVGYDPSVFWPQMQFYAGTLSAPRPDFMPLLQTARQLDHGGHFIRDHLPQLSGLDSTSIFRPSRLSSADQKKKGCILGRDYPAEILSVDRAYKKNIEKLFSGSYIKDKEKDLFG